VKVGIVNYGMGNLGSVRRAFEELGARPFLAERPEALRDADRLVVPGVGAFGEGMARLRAGGWTDVLHTLVRDEGRPLLGICLGMQMLARWGDEGGPSEGLGFIDGRVRRLDDLGCTLRIPHVGWNELEFEANDPLFAHIPQRSDFYFVHSFAFEPTDPAVVSGRTQYGASFAAVVRCGPVIGTQFHPEKSSRAGRQLLRNFIERPPC
jgi:glutamine amidotransferase